MGSIQSSAVLELCVDLAPPVNVRIFPLGPTSVCSAGGGDDIVLVGRASNPISNVICADSTLSYQWYKDGISLDGETDDTLRRANTPANTGIYAVEVANACGAANRVFQEVGLVNE
ncbi:MAG: hypothetical protein HC880_13085, partial [Bacteroidia bacterium]|nr:hypothetical protein [Bacteroidia bacterium]